MAENFRTTYKKCRELFLSNLQNFTNVQQYKYPIGNKDEDLSIDVAVFKGKSDKFLIHISGTHGPEGYAGSAVQSSILRHMAKEQLYSTNDNKSDQPTLILVHALNAYGFHYNRRVNEDNIDLNRNFLTQVDFEMVTQRDPNFAGYVNLDAAYNPSSMPFTITILNDIYVYLLSAYYMLKYGFTYCKRALVAGNYYKKVGLGYGGDRLSASANALIDVIINKLHIPNKAKNIVLLDVHTGLGAPGVDTLMVDIPVSFTTGTGGSTETVGGVGGGMGGSNGVNGSKVNSLEYLEAIFPHEYTQKSRKQSVKILLFIIISCVLLAFAYMHPIQSTVWTGLPYIVVFLLLFSSLILRLSTRKVAVGGLKESSRKGQNYDGCMYLLSSVMLYINSSIICITYYSILYFSILCMFIRHSEALVQCQCGVRADPRDGHGRLY